MAINEEGGNESLDMPLSEESIRKAAADYPVTFDQVCEVLNEIQEVLSNEINDLYQDAWIGGGAENHLFDMDHGVFFAFVPSMLYRRHFETSDVDWDMFRPACVAHDHYARSFGFTVDRPTSYANKLKGNSDYSPFFIEYPPGWRMALQHSRIRMKYLLHHGLTPAEALDYWALKFGPGRLQTSRDRDSWHAARDVDREATYKTVRQAKKKLGDESRKLYYEEQNIEVKKVESSHEDMKK